MSVLIKRIQRIVSKMLDRADMLLLANDLALAPAELAGLINARPDVRGQMENMAKRFGLSGRDIDADRWRSLEITNACGNCSKAFSCERFLEDKATDFTPEACPNSGHYSELRDEKGRELAGLRA